MAGVLGGLGPAGGHRHLDFILCTVGPDLRQRTGNVLLHLKSSLWLSTGEKVGAAKKGQGYPGGRHLSQVQDDTV